MEDTKFIFSEKESKFVADDFSSSDHHDRLRDFISDLNAKKYPSIRINKWVLLCAVIMVVLTAALIIFKRFLIFIAPIILVIYIVFLCCEIEALLAAEKHVVKMCEKHKITFERETGLYGTQILNNFQPRSKLCCFYFYYLGDARELYVLVKLNRRSGNTENNRLLIDAPVYESQGAMDQRIPIYNVNPDKVGTD